MPKLTIICITYNHENYIKACIDGILEQNYDFNVELLIHDDASTDNTQKIIKAVIGSNQRNNEKLKIETYLRTENIYSRGRKPIAELIYMAKGEYIAFCEGDDFWRSTDKLKKQVDFLDRSISYSICYHDSDVIDEHGNCISPHRFDSAKRKDYSKEELCLARAFIPTQTIMFRKTCLNSIPQEYFKVVNEDTFIFVMCGLFGRGKYLEGIEKSSYRIHGKGVWSNRSSESKHKNMAKTYFYISKYHFRNKRFFFSYIMVLKSVLALFRAYIIVGK